MFTTKKMLKKRIAELEIICKEMDKRIAELKALNDLTYENKTIAIKNEIKALKLLLRTAEHKDDNVLREMVAKLEQHVEDCELLRKEYEHFQNS